MPQFSALARALGLILLCLLAPPKASATTVNSILSLSPSTAAQGQSGVTVTFNLNTVAPSPPPASVLPSSVALGTALGSSIAHPSQYVVTAVFSFPLGMSTGLQNATVSFTMPGDFTLASAFTITAAAPTPPTIVKNPKARVVDPGSLTVFQAAASGSLPLSYQWQKDGLDLSGAQGRNLTLTAASVADQGSYRCVVSNSYGAATTTAATLVVSAQTYPSVASYVVVDTGQVNCYNANSVVSSPAPGAAFYGQDAQMAGVQPAYHLSADNLTVYDIKTGLSWVHTIDTNGDGIIDVTDKLNWPQAQAYVAALNAASYGGYTDWRMPSIKEQYSLMDFRGTDPSGYAGTDTSGLVPFIDTQVFEFAYGDTNAGERVIDSQYMSSTQYVSHCYNDGGYTIFGVNFADGRIKGYRGANLGTNTVFYFMPCRGNTAMGANQFSDNGDGTVTDTATGLMWQQADSGAGMNWQAALAYAEALTLAAHTDWRLPNAKELQSILDYTRSPDTTASAAINAVFNATSITGEAGTLDYPWYWSGTTHGSWITGPSGSAAAYLCFGRGGGYLDSGWRDIHGAGAQRSDPKAGSLSSYTYTPYGYYNATSPQGDVIRIYNLVRCVRDAGLSSNTPSRTPSPSQTASPTLSLSPTPSSTQASTRTSTPSFTHTQTPTPSSTASYSNSPTASFSRTASPTFSNAASPSATCTRTLSPVTSTDTMTPTASLTFSNSATPSATSSSTLSPITSTNTHTPTASLTVSNSASPSATCTLTLSPVTSTDTMTPTASLTFSSSATPSATSSSTLSPITSTDTHTPSASPTFSLSASPTVSSTEAVLSVTTTFSCTPTNTPASINPPVASPILLSATPSPDTSPLQINALIPLPNPNPNKLCIKLASPADEVEFRIYTIAYVLLGSFKAGPLHAGWNHFPIPTGLLEQTASGTYYLLATLKRNGEPNDRQAARAGKLTIIR
jgi:hypothetical protein